ncbi:hypothetical protein AVEN_2746-1 [Araneus ventricosus]|uniref:Uncharacterized protein n=1 Tax=Araneus ventricosus TaxID=182803 RepID=A0A4Y2VZ86_ARAVE|nr:hypothetical protein AVEN_2746-1 [Araneus ventricosus]
MDLFSLSSTMQITTFELWMNIQFFNFSCDGRSVVCDACFICSDEFLYYTTDVYTNGKRFWEVWPKNHGLNHLVMEDVLSLKLRPMDAEIGTTYHRIWMAGPKSAKEP